MTLGSGGVERRYFRHVPPAHDGTAPVPLVVDLHGYAEGADVHRQHSQLGPFGDEHGFLTVTPQGTGAVVRWDAAPGSADLTFIGDLLDDVEATACVDEHRVFVTGLSNGAMMTSAVACTYADRVAAVAPVAGVQRPDGCEPSRPVPLVAFHGTADPFVSYEGGLGDAAEALPAPDGSGRTLGELGVGRGDDDEPSVPEIVAAWAAGNGCDDRPVTEEVAGDVDRISFEDCPDGADVELYRVEGGGHSWPGSEFSRAIEGVVGPTTFSISADEVMWAFFEDHPLAG